MILYLLTIPRGSHSEASAQQPSKGILFNKSLPPSYPPCPHPSLIPTFSWALTVRGSSTSNINSTHRFLTSLVHTLSRLTFCHLLGHPHRHLKTGHPKKQPYNSFCPQMLDADSETLDQPSSSEWVSLDGLPVLCPSSLLSNISKKPKLEGT